MDKTHDNGSPTVDALLSVPAWRLWLYRLVVPFAAVAFVLVALEVVLRIIGFGFPSAAATPCIVEGRASFCSNQFFGQRFFPAPLAKQFVPFSVTADKPEGSYRIFVLGGSAAQGTPDPSLSFARILEVMLRETYPGTEFEVVNAAIMAVNSHTVRVIAEDLAAVPGDLFVIYLGNNEVVGPYGPGSSFVSPIGGLLGIRLHIALKSTRTAQLLARFVEWTGWGAKATISGKELETVLFRNQVQADDPRLEAVRRNFERNLNDIVATATENGYESILCTVACNLKDHPPFASLHRPDLTEAERQSWEEHYARGVEGEERGRPGEALDRYREALSIDPTYADLHYRMARCYADLDRHEDSRRHYEKARDLSTLRFRPDDGINEAIRTVSRASASRGSRFVDAAEVLTAASPHGIPGEELFHDHVHSTFRGNYLVAREIFLQIESMLPETITAGRRTGDGGDPPTEDDCASWLAYTEWDELRLGSIMLEGFFKRSLFPNQLYHAERVRRLERDLRSRARRMTYQKLQAAALQYQNALSRNAADPMIAERYRMLQRDMVVLGRSRRTGPRR